MEIKAIFVAAVPHAHCLDYSTSSRSSIIAEVLDEDATCLITYY